jgi:hypothetical protein
MSDPLSRELDAVLRRLQSKRDVLPFTQEMLPAAGTRLAPLPDAMMDQLRTSSDLASIRPGEPVWISPAAPPDAAAEIVLYRAEADGDHYIIAPARD